VYGAWFFTKIRGVRVEEYAYYVNKLPQNVGLETWIWRQIVTPQRAYTKYKSPPYFIERTPPRENFLLTPLQTGRAIYAAILRCQGLPRESVSAGTFVLVRPCIEPSKHNHAAIATPEKERLCIALPLFLLGRVDDVFAPFLPQTTFRLETRNVKLQNSFSHF